MKNYIGLIDECIAQLSSYRNKLMTVDNHILDIIEKSEDIELGELGNNIGIAIGTFAKKNDVKLDISDNELSIRFGVEHGIDLIMNHGLTLDENRNLINIF